MYLFPQRPHGKNQTHWYLQTTVPISPRTKWGKRKKGKVGKPYIRQKTHPSSPTIKRTITKLVINPDKTKVCRWYQPGPRPRHQDRPKPLPCVFYHSCLGLAFTGAHR
jgi:hypothetical protein